MNLIQFYTTAVVSSTLLGIYESTIAPRVHPIEHCASWISCGLLARSMEFLTAKCISSIPLSPIYLLFVAVPVISEIGLRIANSKKDDSGRLYKFYTFTKGWTESLRTAAPAVRTVGSVAVVWLMKSTVDSHPALFFISAASTAVNVYLIAKRYQRYIQYNRPLA